MPSQMSVEDRAAWVAWSARAPEWALREFCGQLALFDEHCGARGRTCSNCGYRMIVEIHRGRKLWHCGECDNAIYPT